METFVVETYRGYEIVEIVTCGEVQGYFGNSIIPATRFFTPAATTLEETKAIIDKSWEIRNSYKRLEYKQKGKRR
jgi:hypothetical protein